MNDSFTDNLIALLPNLKRYAMSLCRSPDRADDLVQITAERAIRARDNHDPSTRLEPWLFRILRNAWIDEGRRDRTRGVQVPIEDQQQLVGPDGGQVAENRLMLQQTAEALNTLSQEQREALILVCMQGMSYQETADILDIPIGTVMSRLARGRKVLMGKLGGDIWE